MLENDLHIFTEFLNSTLDTSQWQDMAAKKPPATPISAWPENQLQLLPPFSTAQLSRNPDEHIALQYL